MSDVFEKIVAACERAQEQGIDIAPGDWGIWDDQENGIYKAGITVCPMGAVLIGQKFSCESAIDEDAAQYLNVGPEYVEGFTHGFDNYEDIIGSEGYNQGYEDGQRARRIFVFGEEPVEENQSVEEEDLVEELVCV